MTFHFILPITVAGRTKSFLAVVLNSSSVKVRKNTVSDPIEYIRLYFNINLFVKSHKYNILNDKRSA